MSKTPADLPDRNARSGLCSMHGHWRVYVQYPHCNEGPPDDCPRCIVSHRRQGALDAAFEEGWTEGYHETGPCLSTRFYGVEIWLCGS